MSQSSGTHMLTMTRLFHPQKKNVPTRSLSRWHALLLPVQVCAEPQGGSKSLRGKSISLGALGLVPALM